MLSIKSMKELETANYYLNLAREDYYLNGGEPLGKWLATRSSKSLGIRDTVYRDQLHSILQGFTPNGREALTQNAGAKRHTGWDLTFSAPKSVSVLWALSTNDRRAVIESCVTGAVESVMKELDREGVDTRRGKGGMIFEKASLLGALFLHTTSRALDPQLHCHVLTPNICQRTDGTFGTIVGRSLYRKKMALGALFRMELARRLSSALGMRWTKAKGLVEIEGMPEAVIRHFAKRREEIEKLLEEEGESGAKAAERAALLTRETKKCLPREELNKRWTAEASKVGWNDSMASQLLGRKPEPHSISSFMESIEELLKRQSYFSRWEFIRKLAEANVDSLQKIRRLFSAADRELVIRPEIVKLLVNHIDAFYSDKNTLALEKKLLTLFDSQGTTALPETAALLGQKHCPELSAEQVQALTHVVHAKRGISLISGMAGTGKSYFLRSVKEVFKSYGYSLHGTAFSGKASQELERSVGIKAKTLYYFLHQLKNGRMRLTDKSVVILDEAGMVGTHMLYELLARIASAGARAVLVGDERQLQPIEAGGPFKALSKRYGCARLVHIRRQENPFDIKRIKEIADGKGGRALQAYKEHGKLTVCDGTRATKNALISSWAQGGLDHPERNLIVTSDNAKASELNRAAQAKRKESGKLGTIFVAIDGERVHPGDRVLFTRNSARFGVQNGALGTVRGVSPLTQRVTVELDGRKVVRIPLRSYSHLRLGYAITTHKAQGSTVQNAFVLLGGGLQDRELTYVQASRARGNTSLFVSKDEAGEELFKMGFRVEESHQKKLATDLEQRRAYGVG